MTGRKRDEKLEAELQAILAPAFAGMTIDVSQSRRWDRMCATFRWPGFNNLLPEERFHRLVRAIPVDFRESRMAGLVWVELAPDEDLEAFLLWPRSEDVADREGDILARLAEVNFFPSLSSAMGPSPDKKCGGGFEQVEAILTSKEYSSTDIRDAKLVFIRHGTYCDCQVLATVPSELAKLHAGAA